MSRLIDADRLLEERRIKIYYHLPNGDIAIPIIDIEHAPTIEPMEWIPCSERLPEVGQKVLASTKKTVFAQVFKGVYSEPNFWAWEHNSIKKVEAWTPLPEPYKGEAEKQTDCAWK